VGGRAVLPGFVDSHVHLDKACLLGRCGHLQGGLKAAIAAVSAMKRDFTVADVYERGAQVLERAIAKGRRACAVMSRSTRAWACAASRR